MPIFSILFLGICFCLFLLVPEPAITGAERGLVLWYHQILPVLLPFSFLSQLLTETRLSHRLSPRFTVLLLGFLCGIPVSAMMLAEQVRAKRISPEDANRLVLISNHPSPAFLVGYLGRSCLNLSYPIILLAAAYIPYLIPIILFLRKKECRKQKQKNTLQSITLTGFQQAWLRACTAMVQIGGYIMLCSMLASYMSLLLDDSLFVKPVLIGLIEVTTGLSLFAEVPLELPLKTAIGLFLSSFGGCSCIAQIMGCLTGTGIRIHRLLAVKLFCGLLSGLLVYVFLLVFIP